MTSVPLHWKLAGAAGLCVLAVLFSRIPGHGLVLAARWLLGTSLLFAGTVLWLRRRPGVPGAPNPPLVRVVSRAALSRTCQGTLVQVESLRFFVVHGEGFAQVQLALPELMDPQFDLASLGIPPCTH